LKKPERRSILELGALFGIIWSSIELAAFDLHTSWIPSVFGESLVELLASFLVAFWWIFVCAIVDGVVSAATNQALVMKKGPGRS
jgi:hypothetical protein